MRYFMLLGFILTVLLATDDVELYNKLKKVVSKKENIVHKDGDIKVVVKEKDTNLTKKIKKLMKKENIAQTTKKYEKILKD